MVSQQGRISAAGRRLRDVFEDIAAKYNYEYDNEAFKAELAATIEIEGLAKEFGMETPDLTVAQRMQGPTKLLQKLWNAAYSLWPRQGICTGIKNCGRKLQCVCRAIIRLAFATG